MHNRRDFLIEIGTEELPPKALKSLADAFAEQVVAALAQIQLDHGSVKIYATPRRLALFIAQLTEQQDERLQEKRGPALKAAFDANGEPTKAVLGFAKSCQVDFAQLQRLETDKGCWLVHRYLEPGKTVQQLMPEIINNALAKLPIPKRMRWSDHSYEFVRPVHWVVMLLGDDVVPAKFYGCASDRHTQGHRFLAPEKLALSCANDYVKVLEQRGYVLADFAARRALIEKNVQQQAANVGGSVVIEPDLLDEVTSIVEWPVVLTASFAEKFLKVPQEALIAVMRDHQKCFPIYDEQGKHLLPQFITVSNIVSQDPAQVIAGNERVMCARLQDADFFYHSDCKHRLESQLERLHSVIFQSKLGTMYEKASRMASLAAFIASHIHADSEQAQRAGLLAKADLMTDMVGEFPELQGTMGYYYARNDGEAKEVAQAIGQHYQPRFAGDELPENAVAISVALADKLDTLIGIFAIDQIPSGDKDPFALRRAAIGVLRLIIEKQLNLNLETLLQKAFDNYTCPLSNKAAVTQCFDFIIERLRAWYSEKSVQADTFAAVFARRPVAPLDFHYRIEAVNQFRQLAQAQALAAANKRVSNILSKQAGDNVTHNVQSNLLVEPAEKILVEAVENKLQVITPLLKQQQYSDALTELASLQQPIDDFFDDVMVMAEQEDLRHNRLAILTQLRQLFLQVADVSLLQL